MGAQHALSDAAARALLAHGQRLTEPARSDGASVAGVARAVVGIQAQDRGAGALGIRARRAGATASEVARAAQEDRSIVRMWCMRGTLHYVAAEDAGWLIALLGPVALARMRKRLADLGVAGDDALAVVRDVLAERGMLTRREIAAAARERGLSFADDPQAPVHLVARAVLSGEVCEAGWRGGKPVHVLWRDWLPDVRVDGDRDALLAELGRRHAAAHPPAGPEDLSKWSGLGMPEARRAYELIAGELEPVRVRGRDAWVPRGTDLAPAAPGVRLLPAWDNLLLGHRDRELTVGAHVPPAAVADGGILRPTLLVDGQVEGIWRLERGRPAIEPFRPLAAGVRAAAAAERDDVVRFRAA